MIWRVVSTIFCLYWNTRSLYCKALETKMFVPFTDRYRNCHVPNTVCYQNNKNLVVRCLEVSSSWHKERKISSRVHRKVFPTPTLITLLGLLPFPCDIRQAVRQHPSRSYFDGLVLTFAPRWVCKEGCSLRQWYEVRNLFPSIIANICID